jgi:hypothetical protein
MSAWLNELTADQRWELVKMRFHAAMALKEGPNEYLEAFLRDTTLVVYVGQGECSAAIVAGMEAHAGRHRSSVPVRADRIPRQQPKPAPRRITSEIKVLMRTMFEEGLTAPQTYERLHNEVGPLGFKAKAVAYWMTEWRRQSGKPDPQRHQGRPELVSIGPVRARNRTAAARIRRRGLSIRAR